MKSILFSALIVLLFLAILESVSRVFVDSNRPSQDDIIQYVVDSDLLWRYRPVQHVLQPSKRVDYLINSQGLRCREFPVKKPEDERRLLAIGDSVTFGRLVSEGNSYPQILEEYSSENVGGRSVRVINGGVNTYSTREELMFLQKTGVDYDPDVVILGFVLNDASTFIRQFQLEEISNPSEPQVRLKAFCESNDIPFLDLLPTFFGYRWESLYLDDVHFSPEGNRLVAAEIGEFLIEEGFLDY